MPLHINMLCLYFARRRKSRLGKVRTGREGGNPHLRSRLMGAAALSLLIALSTAAVADTRSELAQARHDLAVSEQVLARVSAQAETVRSDPATQPQERERLEEYLAHVRELVAQNRKRVQTLEESLEQSPAGLSAGSGGGTVAVSRAATGAEEVAALDAKLGESLTEFDRLLLEEARKAQARAPSA